MLIKSNFKDYYDFLQGKYGVDTKVVYERVQEIARYMNWVKQGHVPHHKTSPYSSVRIAFCGVMYPMWFINGEMHTPFEARELHSSKIPKDFLWAHKGTLGYCKEYKEPTNLNDKYNCPVILLGWMSEVVKNARLSDYNFGRFVEPEEAYTKIYDFLIREPVIKDNRTDVEKVVSAGFDKKTSFRNM